MIWSSWSREPEESRRSASDVAEGAASARVFDDASAGHDPVQVGGFDLVAEGGRNKGAQLADGGGARSGAGSIVRGSRQGRDLTSQAIVPGAARLEVRFAARVRGAVCSSASTAGAGAGRVASRWPESTCCRSSTRTVREASAPITSSTIAASTGSPASALDIGLDTMSSVIRSDAARAGGSCGRAPALPQASGALDGEPDSCGYGGAPGQVVGCTNSP